MATRHLTRSSSSEGKASAREEVRHDCVRVAAALLTPLLIACGAPPSPTPAPGVSATPAPTAVVIDARRDPLVNPAVMFEPAPSDPGAIASDDILYRVLDGNPANLNPIFAASQVEFNLASLLFAHSLVASDKDMAWLLDPVYVETFKESPDHLVNTFKLKRGLTWHDGHPVSAQDFLFSFQQIMDDRVPVPAVRTGPDQIAKVEALDDLTLRITHKKALATSKWDVGWPPLPKHLYEKDKAQHPDLKTGDYYNGLNRKPIGNGPYRFVEWLEGDRIVLERWPDYPGPKPHFRRVVFRIIPDANVMMLSFNKGDIDEFRMTPRQFATQSGPGSDFAKVGHKILQPEWSYTYIGWNMDGSNPFFSDLRVRQAMTHACNVERMIRDLAYHIYEPAVGPFHPDSWMFDKGTERLKFDLDAAGRLLDASGWKIDEAQGGWRYRDVDGKPVKFEFTLLIPQSVQISVDLAAIFQEDLKSLGVDMKTQTLEWATYQQRTRKHEGQAWTAGLSTGIDPDQWRNGFHSDQYVKDGSHGRNYGGYKNARVDELFDLGRAELDRDKRAKLYQELGRLIYADQPCTFLWYRGTLWAVNQRIRGVTRGPQGIFRFEPADRGWWVPAGEAKAVLGHTP